MQVTKTTKNHSLSNVKYMLFGDWRNSSGVKSSYEQTHIQAKHPCTEILKKI